MTTNTQHAIDLMPQLRDVLGLPQDLDLPRLCAIVFTANADAPGWDVYAQLKTMPDADSWDALLAWSGGATPKLSRLQRASYMPSGKYRKASVQIRVGEVAIEVWCHVDSTFVPPEPEPRVVPDWLGGE